MGAPVSAPSAPSAGVCTPGLGEDSEELSRAAIPYPTHQSWIKRSMPRTLLGRSLMIVVTPLILTQLVSTWVFYDRHFETLSRRLADGLAGDIHTLIRLRDVLPPEQREGVVKLAADSMNLNVRFDNGAHLALPETGPDIVTNNSIARQLARQLDSRLRYNFRVKVDYFSHDAIADVQLPSGVMYVRADRQRLFNPTTYIFLMWMIGSALVLFSVAIIFMRNQIRPVHRLAEAADALGRGVDVPNFKLEGGLEVRRAAIAFSVMRWRIKRQIRQRTEMLAAVSHDLRTPLTRMKLQIAMLEADSRIADMKGDVAEMERMIDGYLAFARGEEGELPAHIDLSALLAAVISDIRRAYEGSKAPTIVTDAVLPGLAGQFRPQALRRALANLVDNACRYATKITVAGCYQRGRIEILIDDNGPGIPAPNRAQLFRPFARLESSRNQKTGGVGLGLTIARDVVSAHGGEISLADSPEGGLRVRVSLPVAEMG